MKTLLTCLFSLLFAAIPITVFILLWSWTIGLVPATYAYAWAAKIAITLGMLLVGGGATIALTIWFTIVAAAIAVAILE